MHALSGFQLPIVDGVGLVGEPAVLARQGKQHDVPLIMGGSSFEGTVQPASGITLDEFRRFHEHDWNAARQLYAEEFGVSEEFGLKKMFGDNRYVLAARTMVRSMKNRDQLCLGLLCQFRTNKQSRRMARHAPRCRRLLPLGWRGRPGDPQMAALSRRLQGYWTNFARSGNPNGASLLGWPAYQASRDLWLVFDNEDQVRDGVIAPKLDYLEAHFMRRTSASR